MKIETTSTRLKTIMAERNLQQVDILDLCKPFCEKFGITLNKSDLSQYISGKTEPGSKKLTILGMALNVSEPWLMGYDVPMKKEVVHTSSLKELLHQIEEYFGKNCSNALQLYVKLDETDQARITERMTVLLEDEKYYSQPKKGAALA